jgi:sulfonate transport system substrate-binding protein
LRALKYWLVAALLLWTQGASAEPLKIRLAYVVPVGNWAPILYEHPGLAKHLGQSYSFEAVHFQGTPQMIQALGAGELEIADLAFSSFAIAVLNAGMKDLRVIADEFQDGVDGWFTNEDFVLKDSPIKTVEDLKGKVLTVNIAGAAVDIALRSMLRKHHLDDKRDVTIVEAPFPAMPAMLIEHKVDLMTGAPPFVFDPKFQAAARPLFSQREAIGPSQMIIWVAHADFIAKHRAALLDFMEDALRTERWYLDPAHHEEVVAIAARVTKAPAAAWQRVFTKAGQNGDFYRDPNGLPNLAALQANIAEQHKLGLIGSSLEVKQYTDLSLVKEAANRLR